MPLLFTIGVTAAIAYELPSKPLSQYAKDIRTNIQNGAYLLRKDQNVSQLTYTDQGPADKANLLNVAPGYTYNPSVAYNKHPYYYKDGAGAGAIAHPDKTTWNRVSVASPNSLYYSNPVKGPVGAYTGFVPGATKLQPVSNKLGYYFGQAPTKNPLASVGNQLSQWMKLLPLMKPNPQKPIYWSDVVKG